MSWRVGPLIAGLVFLGMALPVRAIDPVAQLLPDDWSESGFRFGSSVAMDGDVIVVGSPYDNCPGQPGEVFNPGAIYVFRRTGTTWTKEVKRCVDSPTSLEEFGAVVALKGDYLLANGWSTFEFPIAGVVYSFRYIDGTWVQQGTLTPSISTTHDGFGLVMAMDGDRAVIGSPGTGKGAPIGRAFVFRRDGGSWVEEAMLVDPTGNPEDRFANSVGISGTTVVVGVPRDDEPFTDSGSAFVYSFDGMNWNFSQKLTPTSPMADAKFGSVTIHEGVLLVGAYGYRFGPGQQQVGSVFEFQQVAGVWTEVGRLDEIALGGTFGAGLAFDGSTLIVGTPNTDGIPNRAPGGEVYDRVGNGWVHRTSLDSVDPSSNYFFGASISLSSPWAVASVWPVYVYCVSAEAPCIPTLGGWGLLILGVGVLGMGRNILRRRSSLHLILLPLALVSPSLAWGGGGDQLDAPHRPDRLLVRFRHDASPATRLTTHARADAEPIKSFRCVPDLYLVRTSTDCIADSLSAYESDANVLYVEPDYLLFPLGEPNDPFFGSQWGLQNTGDNLDDDPEDEPVDPGTEGADIRAVAAWDLWTGNPDFQIAVLDTGTDLGHDDLAANIWVNPNEGFWDSNEDGCPGICNVDDDGDGQVDEQPAHCPYEMAPACDDDENGWCDDIYGYDLWNEEAYYADPYDITGHGTHVAGILGAVGNDGYGIAGVNWNCKIVTLQIFGSSGNSGWMMKARSPGSILRVAKAFRIGGRLAKRRRYRGFGRMGRVSDRLG